MSHQQSHKKLVLKSVPKEQATTEQKQETVKKTLTQKIGLKATKAGLEVAQIALSKVIIPVLDIVAPDSPERSAKKLVRKIKSAK